MTTSRQSAPRPRTRLVIADDHAPTRRLLRALAELAACVDVVAEATNGREAVDMVRRHEADAVVLDVDMPALDGIAAAQIIRSRRPHVRVILHTAEIDAETRSRAAELGLTLLVKGRGFRQTIAMLSDRG